MTESLAMHLADDAERIQAFENVHEFWDGGRTLEEHLAWRLQSPQHRWADWYVGCLDGRVVTSLGAYPIRLRSADDVWNGMAVGAVHTVPEFRGRGLAPQLLNWVERHHTRQGTQFSLLFSDIDPDYYARLGYRACPSWNGRWQQPSPGDAPAMDGWTLQEFDPAACLAELMRCYSAWQRGVPASVERDADYWGYLAGKAQADRWVWLIDDGGRQRGYAVYARRGQSTLLREVCADQRDPELTRLLLTRLAEELGPRQSTTLYGWVPQTEPFQGLFEIAARTVEITMIKWCGVETPLPHGLLAAAQWLQELDHV